MNALEKKIDIHYMNALEKKIDMDIALKYYLNDILPTAHNIYGYHPAQETAACPPSPNTGGLDWDKNIKLEEYNNMPSNK